MTLTQSERSELGKLAEGLVGKGTLTALCAYGSKVAGYARPDSDYDIIVVARGFPGRVRYKYVELPIRASALVIDESFLMQDARASALGEFVAGRFLNIYEPIMNPDLLREAEVEFKKRVMVEALWELSSDYGDFSKHLRVPFDYFLFDKLRRRAMVYPPAMYSYVQTYTCPSAKANRKFSMNGFREAAESLATKGFMKVEGDRVVIFPSKMKGDAFTKLMSLFSVTVRGVTQYAVHGYAGRVGLGVFRREASSKLKRMRERPEPPRALQQPKSLLELEEGLVLPDASRLGEELSAIAGLKSATVKERSLGEPYATTRILTFSAGSREWSCVVKSFSDFRSLKWALLGIWAAAARKFSMAPLARLEREYSASVALRENGVNTPRIIAVAPEERVMVKEFVTGPTLASMIDRLPSAKEALPAVSKFGDAVARAHEAGISLGDTKASNVIVTERGVFLTDLEQAAENSDPAWDLAEFLYYTAKLSNKEAVMRSVADSFLRSYVGRGDRAVVKKARSIKYLTPFQPILTPGMTKLLRELMDTYS